MKRLLHHSHTHMIQGESYRLKQRNKAGLLGGSMASKGQI
jgi:DNA replication protein DnaC